MADSETHLRKFHKELSAGIVSLVLLAVLAKARKPMYGYQIAKQLDESGEGVLSGPQSFPAGGPSTGIDAVNLDGDTDVDLVVANYGFFGNGNTISVLRNNGSGSFAAPVSYFVGPSPNDIKVGDLDNDGDADVAVAHDGSSRVSVLFNQGNGAFGPVVPFDNLFQGAGPPELAVLDLDGDQDLDILRAGYYDQEVKRTTKRLTSLLEPALILGMGLIIGTVVVSMLLAIFSINDLPF